MTQAQIDCVREVQRKWIEEFSIVCDRSMAGAGAMANNIIFAIVERVALPVTIESITQRLDVDVGTRVKP